MKVFGYCCIYTIFWFSKTFIMKNGKDKKKTVKREAVCKKTPRYFAFVLGMGKIEYPIDKIETNVFEKENSGIIVYKRNLYTKKEFEDHKVQKTLNVASLSKPSGASAIAEAESLIVLCPQDGSFHYFQSHKTQNKQQ